MTGSNAATVWHVTLLANLLQGSAFAPGSSGILTEGRLRCGRHGHGGVYGIFCKVRVKEAQESLVDDDVQNELDQPCHELLAQNRSYLKSCVNVKFQGEVDGFSLPMDLGLDPKKVPLVVWGSPHAELSNGKKSLEGTPAAANMKACVFKWLCHNWKHSVIIVTYARHCVEFDQWLPAGELSGNFAAVIEGYQPRFSTGWKRSESEETRALVRLPSKTGMCGILQRSLVERHELALDIPHLVSEIANAASEDDSLVFFGEGTCELSTNCARRFSCLWCDICCIVQKHETSRHGVKMRRKWIQKACKQCLENKKFACFCCELLAWAFAL